MLPACVHRVLESEEGRREYLAFPTSKSSGGGQKGRKDLLKGSGRRIDYMLHAEDGLGPDWKAVSPHSPSTPHRKTCPPLSPLGSNQSASLLSHSTQEVEEFSFITQLSGLTDHLPVAMRLMVSSGEEEA